MSSAGRRRLIAVLLATIIVSLTLLPFGLGFVSLWTMTRMPCGGMASPDAFDLEYEAITLRASALDRDMRGYFIPGTNGATIIRLPGIGGGADMAEIALLNAGGYNVLTYESRSCLVGTHSIGYQEVAQVSDALTYLETRPDVDPQRIGIMGFSAGGATATMAAARYPQLRGVIAMGGYHDFPEHLDWSAGGYWFGALFQAGAHLGYWLATGEPMTVLSPISALPAIAPRPVLLIYGTREPSLRGAQAQAAAGSSAELWVVEGATHGTYLSTAPDAFRQRVLSFWETALAADDASNLPDLRYY